jgi:hypothetical protein
VKRVIFMFIVSVLLRRVIYVDYDIILLLANYVNVIDQSFLIIRKYVFVRMIGSCFCNLWGKISNGMEKDQ